jgi:hypothetical protein
MVRGEWVDRPQGDAIYKPYFVEGVHSNAEYVPSTKFPILCGWDPGSVNNAIIFMQNIVMKGKNVWLVFDEIIHNEQHIPYTQLVVEVYRRMRYWNEKREHEFKYIHISDNSAFNQYRAKTGSYDVRDIEQISREKLESFAEYNLEPIRLKAAPKFSGSVETRIRLLIAKLQNEEFLLSKKCPYLKKMFFNMIPEKKNNEVLAFKPKRSQYVHSHDALTYPILYYHNGPGSIQASKSEIIEINA